jgi:hypothetical protein
MTLLRFETVYVLYTLQLRLPKVKWNLILLWGQLICPL